jgi:hypothetical protein
VDQRDIDRVQAHLKRTFGNPHIQVQARPRAKDTADVTARGASLGTLIQDEDEDGSFILEMTIQMDGASGAGLDAKTIDALATHLRAAFGAPRIEVKGRRQKDSAEVEVNGEHIAVVYQDEDEDGAFMFEMPILAEDLAE